MLKKTMTYTDYNGIERTEDFYFNITMAELSEMELSTTGGYSEYLQSIVNAKDTPALIVIFKDLLMKAYGEKSADGRRFIKSKELSIEFSQTEAYSDLFMEFATNDRSAATFLNGIIPAKMQEQAAKEAKMKAAVENSNFSTK